ncbi:MAG: hypothetical protein HWQ35_05720 [Nostoc sp. NMS1]|uniref:hypothetical protein n=1 Tax=Nostoc sp. NMS1 TaxID=2815388 RepID=UPI0025F3A98C|nr:hypothetical protein [Nostoc sp. NMS1]MBN3906060.1 hypothetical protein [Nostoc sp. NMS1]
MSISIQQQAQDDAYQIARDSITSNSLAVLLTLMAIGAGVAITVSKFSQFFSAKILPKIESYLSTQETFIKAINSNSEEIKKNLIVLETDTSNEHSRIISKLDTIELDVKEIKIIIGNK